MQLLALIDAELARRAECFSEDDGILRGVEVFASGTHRDNVYTPADIDEMVANFRAHSMPVDGKKPALRVPAVLGHKEDQEMLERSDLPAAAWARRAWAEDGRDQKGKPIRILKLDFEDVPVTVKRLIRGKRYRTVSAEVYDKPPPGIPGTGKMLRRVAFLGGDIPQVKSLEDIPLPDSHAESGASYIPSVMRFAEARLCCRGPDCWSCSSEVRPMNRDEMLKQLSDLGCDTSVITDTVPDEVIAEWLRTASASQEPPDEELDEEGEKETGDATGHDDADADRTQDTTDHDDAPQMPADTTDTAAMAEYYSAMGEYCAKKMAEFPDPSAPQVAGVGGGATTKNGEPVPKKKTTTVHFSERDVRKIVGVAVKTAKEEIRKEFAEVRTATRSLSDETRRASVQKFCETQVQAGRLPPSALDTGDPKAPRPTVVDRLMRADHRRKVHKFSERGSDGKPTETELTELELQMKEIETGPALWKFGEKLKGPYTVQTAETEDVAKVEKFHEENAPRFAGAGLSKEKLVDGWKKYKAANPEITTEKFLTAQGR